MKTHGLNVKSFAPFTGMEGFLAAGTAAATKDLLAEGAEAGPTFAKMARSKPREGHYIAKGLFDSSPPWLGGQAV